MKRAISLFLLISICPFSGYAQQAEPGGVFYTFDLAQTLEANSDRDLETAQEEDGLESLTTLRFGAVTETRTQRLSFEAGTGIRVSDGEVGADEYTTRLAYRRSSADALLDVSLNARRSEISFLREPSDFLNDEGEIELPEDFDDLVGEGVRTDTTLTASLRWGETMSVGYNISARQALRRYEDANTDLDDRDEASLSFGVRLNINEVTTSNITFRYSQADEPGEPLSQTGSLTAALTFARPRGDLTTSFTLSRDETGETFWAASAEQVFALPTGRLTGRIGVVEDEFGDARFTGRVAFSYPLPTGRIDLSANQRLSAGDDRATTTFSADYLQELSPISSMQIGFDFAQASDPGGADPLSTASLSASYGVNLTPDWELNVGVAARLRDDDGFETRSNSVFITIERPFSFRP